MNTWQSIRSRRSLIAGCLLGAGCWLQAPVGQAQDASLPPLEGEAASKSSSAGLPLLPRVSSGQFTPKAVEDLTRFAQALPPLKGEKARPSTHLPADLLPTIPAQPTAPVVEPPQWQAERLIQEARQQHIADQWRAALDATGWAIAADPTCVAAYGYRAELYAEQQLYAHAITTLTDGIAACPEVVNFWGLRGQYRCLQHDPGGLDDIDEGIRRAGEFSPRLGWLHWLHATSLGQLGMDRACVTELDAIMTPGDELETDFIVRGTSLLRLREWDRAVADFEHAAELKPSDKLTYRRGMARLHAGRFAESLADYEQSRLAYPNSVYVQAEYAVVLAATGRVADAIQHLDALLVAHPKDCGVQTARGWAALLTGDWNRAHTWFVEAADGGAGRLLLCAFSGWKLNTHILDPILADFEGRCRVTPDLPFALFLRWREEARTNWTPHPEFTAALVCRFPFGSPVAPPVVLFAISDYPEESWRPGAHLGEFVAAACLRDGSKLRQAGTHLAAWLAYDPSP